MHRASDHAVFAHRLFGLGGEILEGRSEVLGRFVICNLRRLQRLIV